jgi:hypothetical protein
MKNKHVKSFNEIYFRGDAEGLRNMNAEVRKEKRSTKLKN